MTAINGRVKTDCPRRIVSQCICWLIRYVTNLMQQSPETDSSQQLNTAPCYSVVIPVYNSSPVVEKTIDAVTDFFEKRGWNYELILINDGSKDDSWSKIRAKAQAKPQLVAINLLRNYGQHNAIFCGL